MSDANATESAVQMTARSAGTLSNLSIDIVSYSINSGTSTFRTRKNTANGGQSVSITGTGYVEDTSGTDTIAAADVLDYQMVTSGTSGSLTFRGASTLFAATTNTVTRLLANHGFSLARATTFYRSLVEGMTNSATPTETQAQFEFNKAGTLKNLFVRITAQNITQGTTFTIRKNGAAGNLTVSITGTGTVEDTTNSDSIAVNDLVAIQIVTGTGSGSQSCTPAFIAVDFETTDGSAPLISARTSGQTNSVATYYPITGDLAAATTTEADVSQRVNFTSQASKLWCFLSAFNTSCTVDLRKGAASTALTVSPTGTGAFEDASNTVDLLPSDVINYRMAPGGSCTLRTIGMFLTNAESGQTGRIIATQSTLTFSEKIGRITAAQVTDTFTEKTGRIIAAQATDTFSEKTARITAIQTTETLSEKTGRITAVHVADTFSEKIGRVTGAQASLTLSEKLGRLIALQVTYTWQPASARVTGCQVLLTFGAKTGRAAAAQIGLTFSAKAGRILAAQASLDWIGTTGRISAVQATLLYSVQAERLPVRVRRGPSRFLVASPTVPLLERTGPRGWEE